MIERMTFPLVIREGTMPRDLDADGALHVMGEEEFRAFYERTARPLWAYLSRMSGNRQQADDLLQETYYRFCRAAAEYESETHRRNSLFRIATNLVRDTARRGKHYEEVALVENGSANCVVPVSEEPSPERQVTMRADVSRAMTRLEPLQRELLWLAYAQGASHEEIASILGLRAVSIRTLLLRARRKLARFLAGDEPATAQKAEGR